MYERTCAEVEKFIQKILPHTKRPADSPCEVDLKIGEFNVEGRITDIYAGELLHFRYATLKNRDRLRLWIYHVVLQAKGYGCQSTLICKDKECRYTPIEECEKALQVLLDLYWRGLSKPLHFYPESSWAYARSVEGGETPEKALERARKIWVGSRSYRGECEDLYYRLCFGKTEPLDEEFEKVARDVFKPLLEFEEKKVKAKTI